MSPLLTGKAHVAVIYRDTPEGRKDCARDWLRLEEAGVETRVLMATTLFNEPRAELALMVETYELANRAHAMLCAEVTP